ncbi:MAG: YfiR family protein [Thermoanaerobaculia bacterium]|nr:YfiR family protein [Thermoanaerobaculia bacterium]
MRRRGPGWFTALLRAVRAIAVLATCTPVLFASPRAPEPLASARSDGRAPDKALFLLELARFVAWPDRLLPTPDTPFVIGVLGDSSLRRVLERELAGKFVDSHPVRVVGFRNLDEVDPCPLLYVGDRKAQQMESVVEFLEGDTVLTIGERDDFLERGGVLRVIERPDRIAFEVNLATAARAGLALSSRLLAVADRVVDGPDRGRP